MKLLFLVLLAFASLDSDALDIDTAGLSKPELQAIKEANSQEKFELLECLKAEETEIVDDTACVNEVFGDVLN